DCPCVITQAVTVSLSCDCREHDGFSLREVTRWVSYETSGIPNRRKDCCVGSRITDDRVSILIDGYAGHPPPQPVVAVTPILLLRSCSGKIAPCHIELIPAHGNRPVREIQEIIM